VTPERNFKSTITQDTLASVVVFLVALPLCMGIAIASGAPPAAGLITGIVGGIVVGSISGCTLQVSGPAAGLSVIIYELIQKHGWEMLAPMIIFAGCLQVVAGLLRAGQLFRAIAPAVIYGMLAGIGILIFAAQFHVMVDDAPRESGLKNLIAIPEAVWKGIFPMDGTSHHLAALIGMITLVVLILWSSLAPARVKWIPGALVGVVAGTTMAQVAGMPIQYVALPDNLLGSMRAPSMELFARLADWHFLVAGATLAFVASAETLLSATAVDQMHDGPRTKYDRELFSQGLGNTICGFLGGLPMTGVIVRSATNVAAGARTRKSAILHGIWLLVLVTAAPGILRMVPTASLAAVLVYTGYKLVNPNNIRRLLRYGGVPVAIYGVTLATIVATDLLTGILAGLALSLGNVIYALSHVGIQVKADEHRGRIDVHLHGAATFIRLPQLVDTLDTLPRQSEVHVHIRRLDYIDHACMDAIANWEKQRNEKDAKTVVEWDELIAKYQNGNQLRPAADRAEATTTG
jgi:MFS superfamily sulfate permease-like transporter